MNIVISSGHGSIVRGASGYLDEVDEARRVVNRVAELLKGAGCGVYVFHDDVSDDQNENLNRIVDFHNSKNRELDVSVHFNAYQTTDKPMGSECLYVSQESLADKVVDEICAASGLTNRGPKKRDDLFFLNNTEEPAILIEVCFVDSKADEGIYEANFEKICKAINFALTGQGSATTPPPISTTPPPTTEPPPTTPVLPIVTIKVKVEVDPPGSVKVIIQ
jgi:N-acetylmuramoyl-L-alanine amidase